MLSILPDYAINTLHCLPNCLNEERKLDIRSRCNSHNLFQCLPREVKYIPIIIGNASRSIESALGQLIKLELEDPGAFIVISSDFCHFGSRFSYTFRLNQRYLLYEDIEALDRQAIEFIENCNSEGFHSYLSMTGNTICGRHAIAVLLDTLKETDCVVKCMGYAQSSRAMTLSDSSVSYVSCLVWL